MKKVLLALSILSLLVIMPFNSYSASINNTTSNNSKIEIVFIGHSQKLKILHNIVYKNFISKIKVYEYNDLSDFYTNRKTTDARRIIISDNLEQATIKQLLNNGVASGVLIVSDGANNNDFIVKEKVYSVMLNTKTNNVNYVQKMSNIAKADFLLRAIYPDSKGFMVSYRFYTNSLASFVSKSKILFRWIIGNVSYSVHESTIKTMSTNDWVKKWEDYKEFSIDYDNDGKAEMNGYTRITIYKLSYTDTVTNTDYYRIDFYVQHEVRDFEWSSSLVGPYVSKRIIYSDVDYGGQELYKYGPTTTIGSTTTSFSISFSVSNSGGSVGISYSKSWPTPDVKTIDHSSMVDDYAKWDEEFRGPDYSWWPIMGLCTKPADAATASFYSEPSLVIQTPMDSGILVPKANTTYKFYVDRDFHIENLIFVAWDRYEYSISLEWTNISVDRSSGGSGGGGGGGGGHLVIMSESPGTVKVNGWRLNANDNLDFQIIVNISNPANIEEFWAKISYSLNDEKTKTILIPLKCINKTVRNGKQFELWMGSFTIDRSTEVSNEYDLSINVSVIAKNNEQYVIIASSSFRIIKTKQNKSSLYLLPPTITLILFVVTPFSFVIMRYHKKIEK